MRVRVRVMIGYVCTTCPAPSCPRRVPTRTLTLTLTLTLALTLTLTQEGAEALLAAADAAVEQALGEGEALTIYTAVGAAREAMSEGLWRGGKPTPNPSARGAD